MCGVMVIYWLSTSRSIRLSYKFKVQITNYVMVSNRLLTGRSIRLSCKFKVQITRARES